MNKSESINTLSAALVRAQRQIGGAVKEASNPFFRSKYADLGEVMVACKAALLDEGIAVAQLVTTTATGPGLETMLVHESGEWLSSTMPIVCAKQNDPQALGSAITYARRYALQSALFIPAVDDDAEAAMYRDAKPPAQPVPLPRKEPVAEATPSDFRETRIHFGVNRGLMLSELNPKQVNWLETEWMRKKELNGPTCPEDLALINALKEFKKWRKGEEATLPAKAVTPANVSDDDDNIPF